MQAVDHILIAIGHYSQLEKTQENEMALQELLLAVEKLQCADEVDGVAAIPEKEISNSAGVAVEDIEIERICDMRAGYKLHLLKSGVDGDIHIAVMPEADSVSFQDVEFCASASQSPHTFKALCDLVKAMQLDTQERPQA